MWKLFLPKAVAGSSRLWEAAHMEYMYKNLNKGLDKCVGGWLYEGTAKGMSSMLSDWAQGLL